jgi:STE24 endopeptidase
MTATRTALGIMAAALWVGAAWLLLRTTVPDDLALPDVAVGAAPAAVARAGDYAAGARPFVLGALLAPVLAVSGLAAVAPQLARRLSGRRVLGSVAMLVMVLVVAWAAALPFRLALHRHRREFGLARQNDLDWLVSPWLETLASVAVAVVALLLAIALARRFGERWWIPGALVLAGIGSAVVLLQPLVLAPRLEPLQDRALAAEIRALATRAGVRGVDVDVLRASERTTALNAEVAGLGATRRVVLWDTLLGGRVPPDEIRFLAAHELAHQQRRHLLKGVAWFALVAPLLTWLVAVATHRRGGIAEPAAVPVAVLVLLGAQLLLLPGANAISRRYEAEADWRALELTHDPAADRGLMRRFVGDNLADPSPPAWSRLLLGTHPTVEQRVAMARAWEARGAP